MVGAVGFLVGFFAWFLWLLLAASSWLSILWGLGHLDYMSGIFFQNRALQTVFLSLLPLSLALESFGCFALKRKHGSNLALGCGVLYLAISAVLTSSLIAPLSNLRGLLWYIYYNPATLLSAGLLVLGATLLSIRKSLPDPRKTMRIGLVFILISAPAWTNLYAVIWYWGFETWLLLFGWLYAINAVATARLMLQMRA
jgi:hypothetical protein